VVLRFEIKAKLPHRSRPGGLAEVPVDPALAIANRFVKLAGA
jgi:hypothetical protein